MAQDSNENVGIRKWLEGKSIFVSGGTGFMGKVLVEKLLRSCNVDTIFILCRSKKGKSAQARIDELKNLVIFDRLKKEKPEELKKIVAIEGDILQENLGLKEESVALLRSKVSVVFNVAADVKLDSKLKETIELNTRGTLRMLELAKDFPYLKVFCHVSTAFCHSDIEVLEEKLYDSPANPKDVLAAMSWMTEEMVEHLKPMLLGKHPNSYTYSKRLAEGLMDEYGKQMPIVVCRAAIVVPSFHEPMPGWVDNLNGPVGLLVAGGKGVLRSMLGNPHNLAQVMPVDLCMNTMIFAAWNRAVNETEETTVYNITCIEKIELTWGMLIDEGHKALREYPLDPGLWTPGGTLRTNPYTHALIVFFFQVMPAYLIDFILLLLQKKRFMVRVQKRLLLGTKVLQYFTMKNWIFSASKVINIASKLDMEEREIFVTTNLDVNIQTYMKYAMIGSRVYCLKEPLENQPRAKSILTIVHYMDILIKFGIVYFMLSYLWPIVTSAKNYFV